MKHTTDIYHLFSPRSESHGIALARAGFADGADGTCFELTRTPLDCRTVEVFRRFVEATPLPKIFCVYRHDEFLGADDEARMGCLLKAAEAGAYAIDVMADLYDPSADQISRSAESIRRQKEAIAEIHARGAKAVMSSHITDHALTVDQILAHLGAQAERGADICKLVSFMPTFEDFLEGVKALMRLHDEFDRPWIFLGSGPFGRMHRFIGPQFGCRVEFAVHDYDGIETYDQPTIRQFRQAVEGISWEVPRRA